MGDGIEFEGKGRHSLEDIPLALAGIIYAVVVTVAGVLVTNYSMRVQWVYAGVVLGLLALGLLFPTPVVGAMRRLQRHAEARTRRRWGR